MGSCSRLILADHSLFCLCIEQSLTETLCYAINCQFLKVAFNPSQVLLYDHSMNRLFTLADHEL